jgi:hypothetical protein
VYKVSASCWCYNEDNDGADAEDDADGGGGDDGDDISIDDDSFFDSFFPPSFSAQVFSGDLHLNQAFQDEMSNRSSVIFQQTAARISEAVGPCVTKPSS